MSATSTTLAGRRAAEALMTDTCTIRRPSGAAITDPDTGVVTQPTTVVYTGRCKVQGLDPQEQTPEAGGHTFTVQRYRVDVPVGSYAPRVGDLPTLDTAALDPFLVGREFRVVALLHKSQATAYRLAAADVSDGPV